jgi:hypothetical protein
LQQLIVGSEHFLHPLWDEVYVTVKDLYEVSLCNKYHKT